MAGMLARSGPPGNKNDVKHGLYAYKAMLEGKGPPPPGSRNTPGYDFTWCGDVCQRT